MGTDTVTNIDDDVTTLLPRVKTRIGLETGVIQMDELLKGMLWSAVSEFRLMMNIEYIPDALAFVLVEVTLVKYNSVRGEGFSSTSQDGYSWSRFDADDFFAYQSNMTRWAENNGLDDPFSASVKFIGGGC